MLKNKRIHRWLSGSFICKKCEREFHTMSFGYGEIICPDCYEGERRFISFDDGFWLNRIVAYKINQRMASNKTTLNRIKAIR